MFAHRLAAASAGVLAIGACTDPEARTDLRPAGPPEVLSVLVMTDADSGLIETATFCKPNDEKRPTIVGLPDFTTTQVCADEAAVGAEKVMNAVPTFWFARIMFDELLDPAVEELIPVLNQETGLPDGTFDGSLLNTQPVILTCNNTVVPYDGFYSPSGNNVTWPVGPSLFIQPIDLTTVATGTECTIQIKETVKDKNGEQVPTDQRTGFAFNIDVLTQLGTSPAPADPGDEEEITPDTPLLVTFNGFIDAATLAAGEVTIKEVPLDAMGLPMCSAAGVARTADVFDGGDGVSIGIGITGAAVVCPGAMAGDPPVPCVFNPSVGYVVEFTAGAAVADVAGGAGTAATDPICFAVSAP